MRTEAPVVVEAGSLHYLARTHPVGRGAQTPDGSMTVEPQTCRFWQAALQSGAIDAAALRACWEAIPDEKRSGEAIDRRLARQAVGAGKLTLWQAQQILAGRGFALKIDKYVLADLIGVGGMGRVYLARDTRLHRKVALKILSRERMSNPRALARFEREGKVGAQLQHENLVRIYDEGNAQGLRYLVMEFIEGKNVSHIVSDSGPLPPTSAAKIGYQVSLGLEHARRKGLIHRDVNPQNILVTKDGTAKLTDMGLAIDLGDAEDIVTRDGATVGTFDYISPEQARHPRDVDSRSDLYSLGCSLYHMIAGRVPFPTTSLPEKLYAHQLTEPESLETLVPGVPPELDRIVRRMMAKKPSDRFDTPQAAADALEPIALESASLAGLIEAATPPADAAGAGSLLGPASVLNASALAGPRPSSSGARPALDETGGEPDQMLVQAEAHANAPTASATPETLAAEPTTLGFGLSIDLGPQPSLSRSTNGARGKSRSRSSGSSDRARAATPEAGAEAPNDPARRLMLIAGGVAAALLVGFASLVGFGVIDLGAREKGSTEAGEEFSKPTEAPDERDVEVASTPSPFGVLQKGKSEVVRHASLQEAMSRASGGGGGEVVVGDVAEEFLIGGGVGGPSVLVPGGAVVLRAAPGSRPTLNVRLRGNQPFLLQPNGSLAISGITFRVSFDGSDPNAPTPPLIQTSGRLSLTNCTFVEAEAKGIETTAVSHRGLGVSARDCLFLGFDRCLAIGAYEGSRTTISNCLMVWPEGQADRVPGWGVWVEHVYAPKVERARLTVERTTVLGAAGLIECRHLDPERPIEVVVNGTALRARHVVAWSPPDSSDPILDGLHWSGDGNRFDLQSAAWVAADALGLSTVADAPTDLDSWRAAVGGREGKDSIQGMVEPADKTAMTSMSSDPARYRLEAADGKAVGADVAIIAIQK